jgi:AraC family transcriptional regulator
MFQQQTGFGPRRDAPDELHVFTDRPASCRRLADGHIDFDVPCNVVVRRIASRLNMPTAECRLAVRCVYGGSRTFRTDDGRHVVDDSGFLILNLGAHVSSEVSGDGPVEMFNVTFQPEFAERVLAGMVTPGDRLLDEPHRISSQPVRFIEMRYPHDNAISPVLDRMRQRARSGIVEAGWLEENLHDLLGRMLVSRRDIVGQIARMPASRESTRLETFRRLSTARDYIEANYAEQVRLEDAAGAACLSPHYFLRTFKQAYGITPHQYLTRKRLDVARRLLTGSDLPVTDICLAIGFESLGSFSTLFKTRFGEPPSALRRRDSATRG